MYTYLVAAVMPYDTSIAMHYTPNVVFKLSSACHVNSIPFNAILYDDRHGVAELKHHVVPREGLEPSYSPYERDVTVAAPNFRAYINEEVLLQLLQIQYAFQYIFLVAIRNNLH